ncbi:hypothetical protein D3C81_1425210 [compost metagenome]
MPQKPVIESPNQGSPKNDQSVRLYIVLNPLMKINCQIKPSNKPPITLGIKKIVRRILRVFSALVRKYARKNPTTLVNKTPITENLTVNQNEDQKSGSLVKMVLKLLNPTQLTVPATPFQSVNE